MGSVFRAMGLTVGVCLDHAMGPKNQAALNCDITYITAQNLAWIYLADNSSITDVEELVEPFDTFSYLRFFLPTFSSSIMSSTLPSLG